jgi:hypothetical protein
MDFTPQSPIAPTPRSSHSTNEVNPNPTKSPLTQGNRIWAKIIGLIRDDEL